MWAAWLRGWAHPYDRDAEDALTSFKPCAAKFTPSARNDSFSPAIFTIDLAARLARGNAERGMSLKIEAVSRVVPD